MGLLSSLLTVGGEIIGGPIGGSIGGAIGGAIDQSSASNKASKDQQAAQQAAIAARTAAANQVGTLQAPFVQAGYTGLNALTSRLGLDPGPVGNAVTAARAANSIGSPPNALAPTSTAPSPTLSPVGAAANALAPTSLVSTTDYLRSAGQGVAPDPSSVVNYPPELAATPSAGVSATPTATPLTTAGPAQVAPPSAAPAANPSAAYPVANGTDPGTFGDTSNPVQPAAYATPTPFSYGLSDYTASPGYQYQLDQARKATLAGASATGALQSGAAMKALQDRAQNIAYQDFTNERNFAAGQNQTNVTNALNAYDTNQNVYDNNRNYLTNRFDTQTDNLFKYTGAGQAAAGVVGNADLNVANGNAGSQVAIGNTQAGNALQQANIGTTLGGNLGGLISSVAGSFGGGGTPLNLQTAPNSLGITPPAVNANPAFVNPLPTNPFGF